MEYILYLRIYPFGLEIVTLSGIEFIVTGDTERDSLDKPTVHSFIQLGPLRFRRPFGITWQVPTLGLCLGNHRKDQPTV